MFKDEYEGFAPVGWGDSIGCDEIDLGFMSEEEWI